MRTRPKAGLILNLTSTNSTYLVLKKSNIFKFDNMLVQHFVVSAFCHSTFRNSIIWNSTLHRTYVDPTNTYMLLATPASSFGQFNGYLQINPGNWLKKRHQQ
jgi:hypothetical protein